LRVALGALDFPRPLCYFFNIKIYLGGSLIMATIRKSIADLEKRLGEIPPSDRQHHSLASIIFAAKQFGLSHAFVCYDYFS
jgi:hypothetical protein